VNLEAQVITSICKNKDIGVLFSENVDDMFVSHGDIWSAIKSYYQQYKGVPDVEMVQQKFPDFMEAQSNAPTQYLVDELRNEFLTARLRETVLRTGQAMTNHAPTAVIAALQKDLAELERYTTTVRDLNITDPQLAREHYMKVKELSDLRGGTPGIPTGINAIDSSYAGMQAGHLVVVIGWSGKGKSWWTAYLAVQAWRAGYKPMIVSLEMSPEMMRDRIYTVMGEGTFLNSDLVRGNVDIDKFDGFAKRTFEDKADFIVVSNQGAATVNPNLIQAKIEQHRPDMVIVDYHQLISDNRNSENTTVRNMNVSRELKLLAVQNNIPVVDITAATAEEQSDRKDPPMLHHVAWSKAIEYDADMAMAVHKEADSDIMEIVARKNRHGPLFGLFLNWDINSGVITETFADDS
jgi:replicative DNA helicase